MVAGEPAQQIEPSHGTASVGKRDVRYVGQCRPFNKLSEICKPERTVRPSQNCPPVFARHGPRCSGGRVVQRAYDDPRLSIDIHHGNDVSFR